MATTSTPPPIVAPVQPTAPVPALPVQPAQPSGPDRIRQAIADAKVKAAPAPPISPAPQAPSPAAPPATGADPTPQPGTPPPAEAAPSVPPPARSIDDVDLDNLDQAPAQPATAQPVAPAPGTQPAPDGQPAPDSPLALINRLATDLGVTPESLTTTPAGRQILSSVRFAEAISAPISDDPAQPLNGGLGYTPSTTEIVSAFHAAAAMDSFEFEFESNPQNAVLYLTAPDYDPSTGRYTLRPGALNFIESLPATLDRLGTVKFQNGQEVSLLQHAARPFLTRAANDLYDTANDPSLSPEDKAAFIQTARIFEKNFLGIDRMAKVAPEPDDVRRSREALQAENQRRQAETNQRAEVNAGQFQAAVLQQASSRIERAVDKILTDTNIAQSTPAYALPALRDQIIELAINLTSGNSELGIRPSNPMVWQQWDQNFARWRNMARFQIRRDGVQSLSEQYFRLAQPNIRAAAKRILASHVDKAVSTNGQLHQQAQNGAARVEPGAPASPPPQSVAAAPAARQPGEDLADYGSRLLKSKIDQARAQGQPVRR